VASQLPLLIEGDRIGGEGGHLDGGAYWDIEQTVRPYHHHGRWPSSVPGRSEGSQGRGVEVDAGAILEAAIWAVTSRPMTGPAPEYC
jgi:hypothetical protein